MRAAGCWRAAKRPRYDRTSGLEQDWFEPEFKARLAAIAKDVGSLNDYEGQLSNKVHFLLDAVLGFISTERTRNKTYRTRNEAKADVFDYIERFYNSKGRHSTIGYLSPMEFERQTGCA